MKLATPGSPSSKAMREVAETFDRTVSHEALGVRMKLSAVVRVHVDFRLDFDPVDYLQYTYFNAETPEHYDAIGALACASGWYAYAKTDLSDSELVDRRLGDDAYANGAVMMAEDLGFDLDAPTDCMFPSELRGAGHLAEWAERNPRIWGNDAGEWIFEENKAWVELGVYEDDSEELQVHHLSAKLFNVADRLAMVESDNVGFFEYARRGDYTMIKIHPLNKIQ